MEFWNSRNMLAPPTYTYQAKTDDIDINHFRTILQDGIKFFDEQNILNMEVALITRIIYRMKTKFQNSKDFQTFEKVEKTMKIFQNMNIPRKLEYLLSIIPECINYQQIVVSLPTKNMVDYILVQLQGVGKILSRAIDYSKLTVKMYEHRLHLGHFWKLALFAIASISRIHLLTLNIVKYTCTLYARLLPFSHHLKNVTVNWLPKEYVFPKDLKSWLNVQWTKLEEVIEIPDENFNLSFIDLAGDSDDDVECVEISDVSDILEDFKKIQKTHLEKQRKNQSTNLLSTLISKNIDYGEEIFIDEESIEVIEKKTLEQSDEVPSQQNVEEIEFGGELPQQTVEEIEFGEEILSDSKPNVEFPKKSTTEVDYGEIISSDDEIPNIPMQKKGSNENNSCAVVISNSEDDVDDSVMFISETNKPKKPFITADFIPLGASTPSLLPKRNKRKKNRKNAPENAVSSQSTTLNNNAPKNTKPAFCKALKRKLTNEADVHSSNNKSPKKKKKNRKA